MAETSFWRVAQLTDTHLFAEAEKTLREMKTDHSLRSLLLHLQTLQPQPDTLLLTGDLSQDETAESYQRLLDILTPLGIPAYWLPGNHDRPHLMQQILDTDLFSSDKAASLGNWRVLLLDSTVSGEVHGYLTDNTLDWLETQLQQSEQPTLLALHHPPVITGSAWMDKVGLHNSDALMTRLKSYPQVKLMVFGHIHHDVEVWQDSVHCLGSPSTCVQFLPKSQTFAVDGDRCPGFRVLDLYEDGHYETWVERVPATQLVA